MSALLAAWAVCRDRLLDAGASPEMVERMTRAMDGRIEAALLLRSFGAGAPTGPGGLCVSCGAWRGGRQDENHDHKDGCAWAAENAMQWAEAVKVAQEVRAAVTPDPSAPRKDTP